MLLALPMVALFRGCPLARHSAKKTMLDTVDVPGGIFSAG